MEVGGKGYIADYKPFNFVDGEGVRCSLYVSGCHLHCQGCFNERAQSFTYGFLYSKELEETIMQDLAQPYVQGLSLLGGEPFLNLQICLPLVRRMKEELPQKDLWVWTGYRFEKLQQHPLQKELLSYVDVLIDCPYIEAQKTLNQSFYGSKNQRMIDVPISLRTQRIHLWSEEK